MSNSIRWMILLLLMGAGPTPVFAHGGGPIQIANEPLCDSFVSVWLNPDPPQTNETLHFTVGISAQDSSPLLNKEVTIQIVDDRGVVDSRQATTEQSVNRLFYETDFEPISGGAYTVNVILACDGSDASTQFSMVVERPSFLVLAIPYAVGGFLIFAAIFVWREWHKEQSGGNRPVRQTRSR